jgi:hypothetical protein
MLDILGILSVLGAAIMGVRLAKEAGWRIHAPDPRVWLVRVAAMRVTPQRLIRAALWIALAYATACVAAWAMI